MFIFAVLGLLVEGLTPAGRLYFFLFVREGLRLCVR